MPRESAHWLRGLPPEGGEALPCPPSRPFPSMATFPAEPLAVCVPPRPPSIAWTNGAPFSVGQEGTCIGPATADFPGHRRQRGQPFCWEAATGGCKWPLSASRVCSTPAGQPEAVDGKAPGGSCWQRPSAPAACAASCPELGCACLWLAVLASCRGGGALSQRIFSSHSQGAGGSGTAVQRPPLVCRLAALREGLVRGAETPFPARRRLCVAVLLCIVHCRRRCEGETLPQCSSGVGGEHRPVWEAHWGGGVAEGGLERPWPSPCLRWSLCGRLSLPHEGAWAPPSRASAVDRAHPLSLQAPLGGSRSSGAGTGEGGGDQAAGFTLWGARRLPAPRSRVPPGELLAGLALEGHCLKHSPLAAPQ